MKGLQLSLIACAMSCAPYALAEEEKNVELVEIFGSKNDLLKATGSASIVDQELLEQFEYDDIHRVLQAVPGVYIREEDGYGLRPNIGLRGATTERSSKIALLEDDILISPAPYSAPAAYFFPVVSRISKVEVFKGPSAIRFGPNTVGGTINLVSTPIGESGTGDIDLAGGEQGYRKAYGRVSQSAYGFDAQLEGIYIGADGFKELDGGGDTGFDKSELVGKVAYEITDTDHYQRFLLKVSYSDEVSNETYLGLTDEDFAINPNRRYAASQLDEFDSEHTSISLSHYIELSPSMTLFTQAYRRDFDRDWDRLNRFGSTRPIAEVLASPTTGFNESLLALLTGERDSLFDDDVLFQTLNDREFFSQGIQTKLIVETQYRDFDVKIESGLRVHQDQVERLHRDRSFVIRSGILERDGNSDIVTTENRDETTAVAAYTDVQIEKGKLTASVGTRVEYIDGNAKNLLTGTETDNSDTVVLPGAGVFYQFNDNIGLLAGVNRGFVPNSPTTDILDAGTQEADPEESWNYELGVRGQYAGWSSSLIGFFNDYENLLGVCTFSSGCLEDIDREFNGGEVDVYGAEFELSKTFEVGAVKIPFNVAYTFTESEFQTSFDSDFSQWGSVTAGDELPYLPNHILAIRVGAHWNDLRVELAYKYIDEMIETAGLGEALSGASTESLSVFDLSGTYSVNNQLSLYAKLDNVTDEQEIVSRRPFGARPNKPRQAIVGVKYAF
ncbi:TonB-dependent receptor [Alteromonas sp. 5E99-2]|uniref:TonB-dependent receptor domain-containing protein n=1 Tax=Alteromonas sp. 5E99-2 TaxID=2817683 RepID=UPI001A99B039|nr:TonB-dependent receptor [Alteromonas sp. 5E99-2]